MKLIAKVTLVTPGGAVAPGGEVEIEDPAQALSLITRGFAAEADANLSTAVELGVPKPKPETAKARRGWPPRAAS